MADIEFEGEQNLPQQTAELQQRSVFLRLAFAMGLVKTERQADYFLSIIFRNF